MLIIREEQWKVLQDYSTGIFLERTKNLLRRRHPEESGKFDDSSLEAFIHGIWRKSLDHGLNLENQVEDFISLALLFGENFDSDKNCAWASEIFGNDKLTSDEKHKLLSEHLPKTTKNVPKEIPV